MKNIYFFSDVHLSFEDNEVERRKQKKLLDFLKHIADKAEEVYIVGDLFDFWFEWYHVIPKYWFSVLYQFKQMIADGVKIIFITGNHDFYPGSYLQNDIGIKCFSEYRDFIFKKKRFFVAHGDGIAKKDRGYRILKKITRNSLSLFMFKTFISADLGMKVAKFTSKSSRELKKKYKSSWIDEYYRFAQRKFKLGFDFVILGHLHFPLIKKENGRVYINCGEWISEFTYAVYDGKNLELKRWK